MSNEKDEYSKAMIDRILDKKLIKFDNKQQMSMFFIAYKSIDALYKELSVNYIIPDEIIKRVVLEIIPSLITEYNSNLRKRRSNNINNCINSVDNTICLGRKINGTQCTRKKYNNKDFCKYHITKLSNGRVDTHQKELIKESTDIPVSTNINELKLSKRGRKSKCQFDPRQYDNEYITLWEDIIEGEKVLIDKACNVYTYDLEHPVYIGKKDITMKLNIRKFINDLNVKVLNI